MNQKPKTTKIQIVPQDKIQAAAQAMHAHIPKHGFILMAMPFGDGEKTREASYVSNVSREDAIKILKVVLFRFGVNEEWMTKAN